MCKSFEAIFEKHGIATDKTFEVICHSSINYRIWKEGKKKFKRIDIPENNPIWDGPTWSIQAGAIFITPYWEQVGVIIKYNTYRQSIQATRPKTDSVTYPDDFNEPSEEQPSNDKE